MAAPMNGEHLLEAVQERLQDSPHRDLVKQTLRHHIFKKRISHEDQKAQAERWLTWAKGKHQLKLVWGPVPPGVLPNGNHGEILDVRVFTKHGPDDAVYDADKSLRDKVARGNCFFRLNNGPQSGVTCCTYALKKFTGGLGDDDDRDKGDNFTWKRYFTKPLEETVSVVATRKANGEAAHLSCRKIDGQFVICSGSKNVHMLICKRDHVSLYGEPRYTVAREVSTAVMDCLQQMKPEEKERLLEFLCHTRYTAVFEILNPRHQHVEDLSHLKRPELRFITWTSCDLEPSPESSLCCMPPHVGIEIARALGLPTVTYDVIPFSQVEEHMREVRLSYGYEGKVLYFLDSDYAVIGLLKKKTIWYILCRAIREKTKTACHAYCKSPDSFIMAKAIRKVEHRIEEIQQWLGLDEKSTKEWKALGSRFLQWAIQHIKGGDLGSGDVADLFPVAWKKFLSESELTDKVEASWSEPGGSDS